MTELWVPSNESSDRTYLQGGLFVDHKSSRVFRTENPTESVGIAQRIGSHVQIVVVEEGRVNLRIRMNEWRVTI